MTMSVRNGMLALLAEQPMHGYQLRQEFERRTGGTWPLNIGQVYTTLHRLVRDGLAEPVPAPDGDDDVERFRLTDDGVEEVAAWWSTPVPRGAPAREELAIKFALAVTAPRVDVAAVIQSQRTETLRSLHDYTRLKRDAPPPEDLAWSLVLDSLVFAAEAEVRWLDHVEVRVARARSARSAAGEPADRAERDAGTGRRPDGDPQPDPLAEGAPRHGTTPVTR